MKKLLLVSSFVAVSALSATPVQAADSLALRICEYVEANDKSRLRSFLKQNKLRIKSIFNDINCNGDNLIVFAAKNSALEVGEFIIGKTPAKMVEATIADIEKYSAHLAEDAKERIN